MPTDQFYPFVLEPRETPAIWGGDALVKVYHKQADPSAKIGESWECWDTNHVKNGALAGKTLAELRSQLGASLLGNLNPDRMFPVLTKIIDARDWLSVQVHPDDAYAQRVEHQENGKTECWYVFHAEPNAQLVLGWNKETDRDEYERRVKDGSLGDILRRVPVRAGDTFYLPAGTLHAIGGGIIVFETQQASDLTYRIFDWNRVGADGKSRELHVDKAADVLDYRKSTAGAVQTIEYTFDNLQRTALIADPRFIVERIVATGEPASIPTEDRPLIIMALDKPVELVCDGGTATLGAYQTALVPAAANWVRVSSSPAQVAFMLVTPPRDPQTLPVRLLAAGIAQDRIDDFMEQFGRVA